MNDQSKGIVPDVPLIPDRPEPAVVRHVIDLHDRADLAYSAFDGQWRELAAYPQLGLHLMERWIRLDDNSLEMHHCVCPIGISPARDTVPSRADSAPPGPKLFGFIRDMRARGEAISWGDLVFEVLCKAFQKKYWNGQGKGQI